MKLGKRAKFKKEYLHGFPLVNLTNKHFDIDQGYSLSGVSYIRPSQDNNSASAKLILLSPHGDLVEEEVELVFDYTEAERMAAALEPSSFRFRENTYIFNDPKHMSPLDIINDFEDVIVLSVTPKETKRPGIWNLHLEVRFATLDTIHEVTLEIDYVTLTSEISIEQLQSLVKKDEEDEESFALESKNIFVIDKDFLKSSPPTYIPSNVVQTPQNLNIVKIEYFPPKDIDSKNAHFKIDFTREGNDNLITKILEFEFAKTIRDSANAAIKTIHETEFTYLGKDRIIPPLEMSINDFEYTGKLANLKIVDIDYNYNAIEKEVRFIQVGIIVEYKFINYKIVKTIEFAYSKSDYTNGRFRQVHQESESIIFADKNLDPLFLMLVANKNAAALKEIMANAKINKYYPYSRIVDVKLSRFIPNSRVVIFAIKAEEIRGKSKIIHSFEKVQQLKHTYNEALLEKMKPEDIQINYDKLPLSPDGDFDESIFIVPNFTKIDSIQYSRPPLDSREVHVQLKFRLDNRFVFLEKWVHFKMSITEFKNYQIDMFEQEYLMNISPKDIAIKVDIDGSPVSSISEDDIIGIPDGIKVNIDYKKPKAGTRVARVILRLSKGDSKVAFEQSLIFAKPAE